MKPAAQEILGLFGLPGAVVSMTTVGGAWSNRVYRLETTEAAFAVKELCNPWADERWQEWLDEAWRFERRGIAAGVPAPEPIPSVADGACLAWVDARGERVPVRVHRWVDGVPAHRAGAVWVDRLDGVGAAVSTAAGLGRTSGAGGDAEVMTHGDIDQKNLILTSSGPVLCDWDVAMPLVPRRELADVALSLGAWDRLDVSRRVVRAYAIAGGGDTAIESADLGQSLMTGLDWIAFNVDCAIGRRSAPPERVALAHKLVPELLANFPRRIAVALRVGEALAP